MLVVVKRMTYKIEYTYYRFTETTAKRIFFNMCANFIHCDSDKITIFYHPLYKFQILKRTTHLHKSQKTPQTQFHPDNEGTVIMFGVPLMD